MINYTQKIIPIRDLLNGIEQDLISRKDTPEFPINSLPLFNEKVWGIQPRALTIIGARSSQGKSAFALQLAYDLSEQNIPVLFLSLEMTAPALIERLFSNIEEVDNQLLLKGHFQQDETIKARWQSFIKQASKLPLLITCGVGKNFREVNELIKALEPKPKVIFVDYIQNIAMNPKETREIINEYIRQFRQMALEFNFAGILCSQINRGAEQNKDNEPRMYQLKETGFLEESADQVWLLYWENFYDHFKNENKYKVMVAKNRNGKTGDHLLNYFPQFYKFKEYLPNRLEI